ncbi:hypothetical protein IMCC3317_12190 [Kordia antarctica]|uniref:DUF3857 domain-containing protein n=1 Tax=Kordia antarctica TaxID=1218801 RepID=A0A7L4ZHA4_9FLAO|nr:DUF3857 domain-containing protein [Kordia antarctica]QHI35871.1 hypothetical protein IMCC3317_12190 [Kordia antarctica]
MKKILFSFLCICSVHIISAQDAPVFKSYDWQENPVYTIDESEKDEQMISLKEYVITEFYFEESNTLTEYFLEHRVLWLNSDEKIEDYNKIYIPYSSSSAIEVSKARVINKKGEVLELDKSKILSAVNEETGNNYTYFALEGIEKGSFIEYFYVVKKRPSYKGRKLSIQSTYPKKDVKFDLYSPKNLLFEFKSYNKIPDVQLDTVMTSKKHWNMSVKNLIPLEKEIQAAYDAKKGFIVYKLDKNTANGANDISSYGQVSQNIYSYYYPEFSKKEKNKIKKFIAEAGIDKLTDQQEIIRTLEIYIKTNVFSDESVDNNLEEVLEKKVASESGFIKLYTAIFSALNIKSQIVITTDRTELKFDKSFEANNFLRDFLIYFPKYKKYISPTENESRYGFPPANLTDNYGLFIKEVTVGSYKSAVGKIKYIKPIKAAQSYDKMTIDVSFDEDDYTIAKIKLKEELGGYYAMSIQPYGKLLNEETTTELKEGFGKRIHQDAEIISTDMQNATPELFGVKPFIITVAVESDALVEKAGKKYLFKVGDLIGRQMQLYQEKKRVLPVENEFQRSYIRTINIEIPAGYKVSNLDDIKINNSYTKKGKKVLSFLSEYELKDNMLTITANEYYRMNIIPASEYEEYRKVINSAADFNKITLILEPK